MAIGDIIVGIDIGTSKISVVVGEVNNFNQVEIICTTKSKCSGIKKGKIINEDEVAIAIANAINDAEEEANLRINSAYVTIPGKYVTIVRNSVIKEAKDKFSAITNNDVLMGLKLIRDIELPENKIILDVIPEDFVLVDGQAVSDPIGRFGSSFTINAEIIVANKEYIKQLNQIFKRIDLEIDGIVPTTLAQRNLILDNNELNDNVMILDIGAGNTDIGVFEKNRFLYTNSIPLGGNTITNDIALVLDISVEEAEKLKKQYGLALKSFIDNDNDIILNTCNGISKTKTIKSSELIEIMEARIEEIFSLVNKDIMAQGLKPKINNVILTGQGIASISKSDIAGKIALNIPIKMSTGRLITTVKPSYRTAYALVRFIAAKPFVKTVSNNIDTVLENNILKAIFNKIKEFFYS